MKVIRFSSIEDESNENDGNAFSEEDAYQRALDYALYKRSLAQSLQAQCQAPTVYNASQSVSGYWENPRIIFLAHSWKTARIG